MPFRNPFSDEERMRAWEMGVRDGEAARLAWVLDTLRDEQCVRAFEAVFYRGMTGLDAEAPEPESYEALQAIGAFLERAAGSGGLPDRNAGESSA